MSEVSSETITKLGRLCALKIARHRCECLEEHNAKDCIICNNIRQELITFATNMADSTLNNDVKPIWQLLSMLSAVAEDEVKYREALTVLGLDNDAIQKGEIFQCLALNSSDEAAFEEILRKTLHSCDLSNWKSVLAQVVLAHDLAEDNLAMDACLMDGMEDLGQRLDENGKHAAAAFCFVVCWRALAASKCLKKLVSADELYIFEAYTHVLNPESIFDDEALPGLAAKLISMGKTGLAKEILNLYASGTEQLVGDALETMDTEESKDFKQHIEFVTGLIRLGKVKAPYAECLVQMCRAVIESDFQTALGACAKVESVAGDFIDEDGVIPVEDVVGPIKQMLKSEL